MEVMKEMKEMKEIKNEGWFGLLSSKAGTPLLLSGVVH